MSLLLLVRHGQASLLEGDYDRLSELGHEQARLLGRHWARAGLAPDEAWVGPRLRHRQTYDAVAQGLAEGGSAIPPARPLPELDEHHGHAVLEAELRRRGGAAITDRREYLRLFQRVLLAWARGEVAGDGEEEPWRQFRARVATGLARLTTAREGGRTVVAFTSGGFVAAAVGEVLGLDDGKIVELSWTIRNSSFTELLFSGGRTSLRAYNALPPLEARHHTYV